MNIKSQGINGLYVLKHKDGREIQAGEVIHTHRGVYVVQSGAAPHKEGSTGRVNVRDGIPSPHSISDHSFFPQVLDLHWELVHVKPEAAA